MGLALTIFAGLCLVAILTLFPGKKQRLIGLSLLVPLVAVAVSINEAGKRPRSESTETQNAPTSTHEATTPAPLPTHSKEANHPNISETLARPKSLPGIAWPDPGIEYTSQTLWNRIDGGAEAYSRAGMRRALFATARRDETDIEVQVFDFITVESAQKYFDSVERSPKSSPFDAGDAAVLWAGGGEVRRGRFYARVVLATADPTPKLTDAVRDILQTIAAPLEKSLKVVPTANSVRAEPESSSAPVVSAAPDTPEKQSDNPDLATALDVGEHIINLYGLTSRELVQEATVEVEIITARDPWAAAAWASSEITDNTNGFDGKAGKLYVLARGNEVIRSPNLAAAERIATARSQEPLIGLDVLLKRTTSIEVQLGGWNGRRALGGVLIGTLDDDTDVFIAAPKALDAAWTDLLTHYDTPDATEKKQVIVKDEYQGDVLLTRNTSLILGIVAYADLASAKRLADVLLAEL